LVITLPKNNEKRKYIYTGIVLVTLVNPQLNCVISSFYIRNFLLMTKRDFGIFFNCLIFFLIVSFLSLVFSLQSLSLPLPLTASYPVFWFISFSSSSLHKKETEIKTQMPRLSMKSKPRE
jgi:hypothetical protein